MLYIVKLKGYNMNWELVKVKQTNWIQDDSGYYTLINWIDDNTVRLDVMDKGDIPVLSFQGSASDVRKESARWFERRSKRVCGITRQQVISFEHAAYIGLEFSPV